MSYLTTVASNSTGIYGDGADGDFTLVGDYTQATEKRWNNLTVGNFNYKPAGYRILVKGVVTIGATGSINDDGNNASGATQGAALGARGQLDAGSGAGAAGYTYSTVISGNGNVGGTNGGASGAGNVYNNAGVFPAGGIGGNSSGRTGGAAGATGHVGGGLAKINQASPWAGRHPNGYLKGGSGGGGGALTNTLATLTVAGGGGGGGGGVCLVAAWINNAGRISANGGSGGNASATDPASNGAGGGGGGGGGYVLITTNTPASQVGTVQVNGGAGGTGAGLLGTAGAAGTAGSIMVMSFGGV